jgi:type IV secretion system protein VirB8
VTDEDRAEYYKRATSWAESEQRSLFRSSRWARILAIAFAVIAGLEAYALILLVPLKTVTMVPVLVDRQTGFVEVLKPDGSQDVTTNQALTQSLLAQYVAARESFNITNLAAAYHKVALWSSGQARADYLTLLPTSNPASPLRLYPRTTLVETWVKSISPLGPQTALVRFETRRVDENSRSAPPQEWAAVVAYRFSKETLPASDRWLNPLGFQVVSYHRDAEALPPQPVSPAQAMTSNSVAATPSTQLSAPPAQAPPFPTRRP